MRTNGHAIIQTLALAVALAGCTGCDQKPKHPPVDPPSETDQADAEIAATREVYAREVATVQDADGFIETDACDAGTFTALLGAAGVQVNLRAAMQPDGRLDRRPLVYVACYPDHSASDNSKDYFVAVLLDGIVTGDRGLLESVFDYGRSHKWVMGRGPVSRTFLPTTLRGQYARAIAALGGTSHEPEVKFDQVWTAGLDGYQAHLQVISILAYGKTHGGIPSWGLDRLREQYDRVRRNALFAAAYWRYSGDEIAREDARKALRDHDIFPADRLPTSADRCEPWITQRDAEVSLFEEHEEIVPAYRGVAEHARKLQAFVGTATNPDWMPCPEQGRTHSGGDFLLAEAVLSGRI